MQFTWNIWLQDSKYTFFENRPIRQIEQVWSYRCKAFYFADAHIEAYYFCCAGLDNLSNFAK